LSIGTGGRPAIDFVAVTWSDGVFQSELALSPGLHSSVETERQLSSCPVLFAFDGRHFAFVTDVLGVGGIGTPTSPGVYDAPHPRESVLLPDGLLASRNGRYELKISERWRKWRPGQVRLVAYDLPPGGRWCSTGARRSPAGGHRDPRFYREEQLPGQAGTKAGDVREALRRPAAWPHRRARSIRDSSAAPTNTS
jgi:hypothetical protein